jgi:hypothetical protein
MCAVLAAGVSPGQIADALAVSLAFNTINRLADAFAFFIATPDVFDAGAKYLLARGYRKRRFLYMQRKCAYTLRVCR